MVRFRLMVFLAGLAISSLFPSVALCQEGEAEGASTEAAAPEVVDETARLAGHNAWMLTSSALVLFMTAPGLAMFYGGLVRKKNVLSVMMQCVFLMGLMTVVWALYGYSLAFGGSNPYIGNLDHLFMKGVQMVGGAAPSTKYPPVPDLTFMVFQGMFFIITPALICGAFAERMKFSTMVVFMILWGTLIYCPLAHWVWGGGILAYGIEGAWAGGALDFAGGTVVHISSGVSALICALLLGKRIGFGSEDMRPHNLTYTALGAAMLWVGWFGFNGGSAVASNGIAASAFVVTHFSAAAGALAWAGMEWITRGKPSVLGAASGAVAGLVCITPASGYVQPMPALLLGVAAGVLCYFACSTIKATFGYDDSLDAFGVHGVGGTLGAVLTGIFATKHVNPTYADGLYYDVSAGAKLLMGQIVAVLVTWVLAAVGTFIILKVLDAVMGLRVDQQEELQGLDVNEHGEEGYIFA
jgi:Amt family ammonium transporter